VANSHALDCKSPGTRLGRHAIGAGVPQRPASSTSWRSRADGWAARTGLRRRRPEEHASNRPVCQAERVAPYSPYAPPATTPQTGRFHACFFRPGPRRSFHPAPTADALTIPGIWATLIAPAR
jgi:hypothetical protein